MANPETIRTTFERNVKAVKLKPAAGQSLGVSRIRVKDGTTCEIEGSGWKLTADVGKTSGGNNAGPGPGVFERAALGSCLAIGYSTWAAAMRVPINAIEVEVETKFDARGMLGVDESPPGFTSIQYKVHIESRASEAEVQKVIDTADRHSPVLDDFTRAISVERVVEVRNR